MFLSLPRGAACSSPPARLNDEQAAAVVKLSHAARPTRIHLRHVKLAVNLSPIWNLNRCPFPSPHRDEHEDEEATSWPGRGGYCYCWLCDTHRPAGISHAGASKHGKGRRRTYVAPEVTNARTVKRWQMIHESSRYSYRPTANPATRMAHGRMHACTASSECEQPAVLCLC